MKSLKINSRTLLIASCLTLLSSNMEAQTSDLAINFQVTDVDCYGNNNASIETTVTGGILPYTYIWSNGATSSNIYGLMGGNYSLMVTDATGYSEVFTAQINAPSEPLTISSTVLNVSSFGVADGVISADISGGTEFKFDSPYTFTWSNGGSTLNQPNLAPGLYTLTVYDAHGCTAVANYTISQPFPSIMSSAVNPNQNALAASIRVFPNPTTNNHITVAWKNSVNEISVVSLKGEQIKNEIVNDVNSIDMTNIPTGEYLIYFYQDKMLVGSERISVQ